MNVWNFIQLASWKDSLPIFHTCNDRRQDSWIRNMDGLLHLKQQPGWCGFSILQSPQSKVIRGRCYLPLQIRCPRRGTSNCRKLTVIKLTPVLIRHSGEKEINVRDSRKLDPPEKGKHHYSGMWGNVTREWKERTSLPTMSAGRYVSKSLSKNTISRFQGCLFFKPILCSERLDQWRMKEIHRWLSPYITNIEKFLLK